MKKSYLYGMIVLAVLLGAFTIFGVSNHFLKYYKPEKLKGYKTANSNSNKKPTPTPTPTPTPDPDPNPNPSGKSEVYGYKCETKSCDVLSGTSVINEKYVFIQDGSENIVLFEIPSKKTINKYKKVTLASGLYITQNKNDMYGILKINDNVNDLIEAKYLYIEFNKDYNQFMVTTQSHSSFITDIDGKQISATYIAQIMQYNDKYIVTRTSANKYHVFNFNNEEFLTEYINSDRLFIELVGDYVGVITADYRYVIYDFRTAGKTIGDYQLEKGVTDARAKMQGRSIVIYRANKVLKTIDL